MADVSPGNGTDGRSAVDRKLASARARLFTRLDELERRVTRARGKFDPRALIVKHPLPAVAIALACGLLVGGSHTSKSRLGNQLGALITALAAHALRTVVTRWAVERFRPEPTS